MPATPDLDALFAPNQTPRALNALAQFHDRIGPVWYSDGFQLSPNPKRSGIDTWSADRTFLRALFPFAMANGSGSMYALWNSGESADPNDWPVIVFGDEGGVWVVAKNAIDFLSLLAFDAEPMIDHDSVIYYRDEKHKFSQGRADFINWLVGTFGIKPSENVGTHVAEAQLAVQPKLNEWMSEFLPQ
ncbi:MAG TPA: hypothetical protein VJM31_15090 [Vicinamibacterales bacterium]|nr:hypothetical protein [Vicinamibacterales bacterium]